MQLWLALVIFGVLIAVIILLAFVCFASLDTINRTVDRHVEASTLLQRNCEGMVQNILDEYSAVCESYARSEGKVWIPPDMSLPGNIRSGPAVRRSTVYPPAPNSFRMREDAGQPFPSTSDPKKGDKV